MGESASSTELEPFGVAIDDKRAIFEEAVRAIMPMFKDGGMEQANLTPWLDVDGSRPLT